MHYWLSFYRVLLLTCISYGITWGQVIIPPENVGEIDSSLSVLSYPENIDRALELLSHPEATETQFELSEYYGLQALSWAKENNDPERALNSCTNLAFFYSMRGQYAKTDSFYNLALEFAINDKQKAYIYLDKAGLQVRTNNFENWNSYLHQAREYIADDTLSKEMAYYRYTKGLYLFEKEQDFVGALTEYLEAKKIYLDEKFVHTIDENLINLYGSIELFDKAEELIISNLDYAKKRDDSYGELFGLYGLGYISMELKKYDQLKKTSDKLFELRERTGISPAFGFAYYLRGSYFLETGQLDSAAYAFQEGITLSEKRGEKKELIDCLEGILRLKIMNKQFEAAISYGEQALLLNPDVDQEVEKHLSIAYKALGQYQKAYELLEQHNKKNDSNERTLTNTLITKKLLEDRFEEDIKQSKIDYKQNLSQQRYKLLAMTAFIVFILSLVIIISQARSRRRLKELNQSLLESNQSLRQFAYITSHDLKEPVRNITSFSNLLSRRLGQKENTTDEKDFLTFIISNAIVLREIVDSLQIFTNISFGKIEKEAVNLDEVFTLLENNLQQIIAEKNGLLLFHKPREIQQIDFSRSMLILVLQNLIINGFKYNQSTEPKVEVNVKKAECKCLFEIKDNGEGIELAYFEKIFKPFKTLKNKSLTQSSGLGLSICKNILERYNGRIWVESDGKSGSTFFVLI